MPPFSRVQSISQATPASDVEVHPSTPLWTISSGSDGLPLPRVQKEAKKLLTKEQLREGIALVKRLRFYPQDPELSYEPCGDGLELRVSSPETPSINQQGWLRAVFWVHEKSRTIYVVDLFWKKTNKISVADLHRINHRLRQLKELLQAGGHPWKSGQ